MAATVGGETAVRAPIRHRRGLSWIAVLAVIAAVVLPVIGAWNPWNLVLVDRALLHPALAGIVVAAALCALTHLRLRDWLLRLVVFAGLSVGAGIWLLGWLMVGSLMNTRSPGGMVASPFDDVEVAVDADPMGSASVVWLRADRGLLSRENQIAVVGSSGSGPPTLDFRFTGPGRLVVLHREEIVAWIRFDPRDLDVVDTECRTLSEPPSATVTSCTDDDLRG